MSFFMKTSNSWTKCPPIRGLAYAGVVMQMKKKLLDLARDKIRFNHYKYPWGTSSKSRRKKAYSCCTN